MMFKQILSYKEILDLSIKKTNLSETFSANKLSRVSELLGDSSSDQSNVVEVDCLLIQNEALLPVLKGNIGLNLGLSCQRCLGQLNWTNKIALYIEFEDSFSQETKHHSQIDKIEIDGEGISIEKIIEDEILSIMPMSIMHKSVELCENNDTVGMFLTTSSDKIKDETKNTPFANLSDLIKK